MDTTVSGLRWQAMTKQGSKRKRNPKDEPSAADQTRQLNSDQYHDEPRVRNQVQATNSHFSALPISPNTNTTETPRPGPTAPASLYTAGLPSGQGHRETVARRHHGSAHSDEQSYPSPALQGVGTLSCVRPIAYTRAQPCGSSFATAESFDHQRSNGTCIKSHFDCLDHDIDADLAVIHHRLLRQPASISPGPVVTDEDRTQYQHIAQSSQISPTQPLNSHPYSGAIGFGSIHTSSAQSVSSFQPPLFGSIDQARQSSSSAVCNPDPFVPGFGATTTSKSEDSSVPNCAALPVSLTDGQSAALVASPEQFHTMGGGEIYPPRHDNYKQFALHHGEQEYSSSQPQQVAAESLPDDLELSTTEPELSSKLLSSQAAVPGVQLAARKFRAKAERYLTERRPEGQSEVISYTSRPSPASEGNATQLVKKRGPFINLQKRKETAETRRRKACLRCRVQKIRCDADPGDAESSCIQCRSFSKVSKKTLHHVSCYRNKLTDVVLFRKGGLNLTARWKGTEMKDVGDRIPEDTRSIQITLGLCEKPIEIKVVRFRATSTDVVARFWTVKEGDRGDEIKKKKDLEPFCLVDIWATASYFERYIIENAISSILKQHTPHKILRKSPAGQDVIKRTYIAAVEYYLSLDGEINGPSGKIINPQKKLLGNLFVFWHAMRHTTGSAYICGEDTLGMKPEVRDETYPLFGKVSVPRMILAQFDSINHSKLLCKYGHKVLRDLELFIFRNQSLFWWPIYLTVFILLHEASFMSADRYRHARNNFGGRFRYSVPNFVEELQDGCNNILVHWHYYNCHPWPDPEGPWQRHKHFMSELTSEQYDLVMDTMTDRRVQKQLAVWANYKEGNAMKDTPPLPRLGRQATPYMGSQTNFDWDHPCYWIAQMFEERWQAHPTYQREYAI